MIYSIDDLKRRIAPIADKYRLRAVYLFGSYARDEASEGSDVDVLIDRTGSRIESLFDMGGLYADLCEHIGKDVDLVTTHALEQDGDADKAPGFAETILKERVTVYERQ